MPHNDLVMALRMDHSDHNLNQQNPTSKINNLRLQKQFEYLRSTNRPFEQPHPNQVVFKAMLQDHQNLHIFIPQQYPFMQPQYALSNNLQDKIPVSDVIEQWVPKIKIFQLIQLLAKRINESQKISKEVQHHVLLKAFHSKKALHLIIVLAIVIRIIVALGPYSGRGEYPNLGDFEAHRNWMSITLNRPISQWYDQHDEQPWWRIDYPPVAAYLSYFFGKTYQSIQGQSMRIQRGYQSETLKVYMRFTALLVDMVCLFPPIYLLSRHLNRKTPQLFLLVFLLKPDVIMIDHGHFQYNSLILGLILLSFYFMLKEKWYLTCLCYTLTIHAKQMAVYYSLAFLAGLVGVTYSKYKYNKNAVIAELVKYAGIVVIVSLILWAPWMGSMENLSSVVTAIFPVHRGLYQLKVPNFWCISDVFMNWQRIFSKGTLVILCFLFSTLFSLPSMFSMIINPSRRSLILGFSTISLTFFMFSYHVHQKSILLPLLMMPLAGQILGGWLTHELTIAGVAGLFHLCREDNQEFGYFGIGIIYTLFSYSYVLLNNRIKTQQPQSQEQNVVLNLHRQVYERWPFRIIFFIVIITLHVLSLVADPPSKLPYLWSLLLAFFSFLFNAYFLLLTNLIQLQQVYSYVADKRVKHQE